MSEEQNKPPEVLDYQFPSNAPRRSGGAIIAGFFAAVGITLSSFMLLAGTISTSGATRATIMLAVLAGYIAASYTSLQISRKSAWFGFGLGFTIGLSLGMLAMVPCGAIYIDGPPKFH